MKTEIQRISSKIAKLQEQSKVAVIERHIFAYLLIQKEIEDLKRQKEMIKEYFKKK